MTVATIDEFVTTNNDSTLHVDSKTKTKKFICQINDDKLTEQRCKKKAAGYFNHSTGRVHTLDCHLKGGYNQNAVKCYCMKHIRPSLPKYSYYNNEGCCTFEKHICCGCGQKCQKKYRICGYLLNLLIIATIVTLSQYYI